MNSVKMSGIAILMAGAVKRRIWTFVKGKWKWKIITGLSMRTIR